MRKCLALLLTSLTLFAACRAKEAKPDITGLVAALQSGDAEKSGRANLELIRLGEPAVPGLIEMLKDPDPRVRGLAASTFWGMGGKARAAVPALAEALSDPDPSFRTQIAMALENMGPDAKDAVPALIRALSDPDRGVRQASVKALGRIGPAARAAVPALSRALKKGSWPEAQEAILLINGGELDTTSGDPIVPKP
jgi:HEAT repeat protein